MTRFRIRSRLLKKIHYIAIVLVLLLALLTFSLFQLEVKLIPFYGLLFLLIGTIIWNSRYREKVDRSLQATNQELHRKFKEFETIFTSIPAAVVYTNNQLEIVLCNAALYEMFGYQPEEIIGQPFSKLLPNQEAFETQRPSWLNLSLEKRKSHFEEEYCRKNGERFFGDVVGAVIADHESHFFGYFVIISDITETKQIAQELAKYRHRLEELVETRTCELKTSNENLQNEIDQRQQVEQERLLLEAKLRQSQKMEAIGTLAGGIAHDFNNILHGIMLSATVLKDQLPTEMTLQRKAEIILEFGKRGEELIRQILTYSHRNEEDLVPFRVTPVVKEALRMIRAALPTTIVIEEHIDCPQDQILGNPSQIHQIIINLCNNAGYEMQESGGRITVDLTAIAPASHHEIFSHGKAGTYLQLSIQDTGRGMPPEIQERIFEPFFTTKPVGEGTGLGLSVLHGIVENHQGTISVHSEVGKGTIFQILLPLIETIAESDALTVKKSHRGSERILLVDDEKEVVDLEKRMLELFGYTTTAISSSVEAVEVFRTQPDNFDIVITDQTMPQMTGFQLSEALFKIRPDTPVILATGYGNAQIPKKTDHTNIRAVLKKPFEGEELTKTIREIMDQPS